MRLSAFTLCAALLVAAGAPQVATAQSRAAGGDSNGDGRLSLSEFQALQGDRLMRLDADGDGRLSRSEWSARPRGPNAAGEPDRAIAVLDRNRDGFVARAEVDIQIARRFARLDADKDGQLTASEQQQARTRGRTRGGRAALRP